MKIESVRIENFRSIKSATIPFNDLTVFVGSNGAGKSTVLRAISQFFEGSNRLQEEDYFQRDIKSPIEIEITFRDLSKAEHDTFKKYVFDNTLVVTRRFTYSDEKSSGKYFGSTLKNPEFEEYRKTDSVTARRSAYKALRENAKYASLAAATARDDMDAELEAWEQNNPSHCARSVSEVQFLGYTGVAKGTVARHTRFVLVPAVRDASAEASDSKSPIHRLLEVVVSEALEANDALRKLRNETDTKFRTILSSGAVPELDSLSTMLSDTMATYYPESGVKLTWQQPGDLELPSLRPDVLLRDEGFTAHVGAMGHGLQRAFVMTLLQHLAIGLPRSRPSADTEGDVATAVDTQNVATLIVGIEEPELYQHPTRQRHFANLLRRLASIGLANNKVAVQIVSATHSPSFVSIDYANEIRITRKKHNSVTSEAQSVYFHVTNEEVDERLRKADQATGAVEGLPAPLSVIPRGHHLNPELNEGFFARGVVLCEGISDVAAVLAQAKLMSIDLTAADIAVLPCNGKGNIDRPLQIFSRLNIPCYCVWDSDARFRDKLKKTENEKAKSDAATAVKQNRLLLDAIGEKPEDWPQGVFARGAAFEDSLEITLKTEIGEEYYNRWYEKNILSFGYSSPKDARKAPYVVEVFLKAAKSDGHTSNTLEAIIKAVSEMMGLRP